MGATPCQVKFILELNYSSPEQRERLSPLYNDKFIRVLREAKGKKYLAMDYAALAPIRGLVGRHPSLEALMPYLKEEIGEAELMVLLGIAPLFNMAPTDLKAYILMSKGLRNVKAV